MSRKAASLDARARIESARTAFSITVLAAAAALSGACGSNNGTESDAGGVHGRADAAGPSSSGGSGSGSSSGGSGSGSSSGGGFFTDPSDGGENADGDDSGTCDVGSAGSVATQESLNLFGMIVYFGGTADGGKILPMGRYRVKYVDGCMKYASYEDWAVQATADGSDAFWLGTKTGDKLFMPPGTIGYEADGGGGFSTFDECVAANLALPATEFDFAGGELGVWLSDNPYSDNVAGTDGRNPKWSLTLLGDCSLIPK